MLNRRQCWGITVSGMLDLYDSIRPHTYSPDEKMTDTPRAPSWPIIWQTFSAYARGTDCSFSPYDVVKVCGSCESSSFRR